jgi:hypothetical protein
MAGVPEMAAGGGEQKASVGTPAVFISYASQAADVTNSIGENLEAEVPKFTPSTRKVRRPLNCVES